MRKRVLASFAVLACAALPVLLVSAKVQAPARKYNWTVRVVLKGDLSPLPRYVIRIPVRPGLPPYVSAYVNFQDQLPGAVRPSVFDDTELGVVLNEVRTSPQITLSPTIAVYVEGKISP